MTLAVIVAAYLLLCVLYSRANPLYEGFDEPNHLGVIAYVQHMGEAPRMPSLLFEAVQPPLYYFVGAAVCGVAGLSPSPHPVPRSMGDPGLAFYHHGHDPAEGTIRWLRFMDSLLGGVTLILVFLVAVTIFPGRWSIALGSTAVAAFIPQFIFVHSLVNNDALANTVSAALLLGCTLMVMGPTRRRRLGGAAVAGLCLGLGLLTKEYFLALLPLPLIAAVLADGTLRQRVAATGIAAVLVALISSWYFAVNHAVYGEFRPVQAQRASLALQLPQSLVHKSIPDVLFSAGILRDLRQSFWYRGGWGQLFPPQWVYVGLDLATVVVVAGLLLAILRPAPVDIAPVHRRALLMLAAAFALMFAGVAYQNLSVQQYQGRYFFPVIAPIALFVCFGSAAVLPRRLQLVGFALPPVVLLCLSLFVLGVVIPHAYGG